MSDEKKKPLSEEKQVGLWQERQRIAVKDQENWADDSGAKRFIEEYKGNYQIVFQTRLRKIKVPPINEVFSYVQTDISTSYFRDPYLTVNPKAGTPRGAAFWEVILNYYWRHLNIKEEMEYEIIDKDLVGYGFHKVGYDAKTGKPFSNFVSWKDVIWNIGSKRVPNDCQWMANRIVKPLSEVKRLYPSVAGDLEGSKDPAIDDDTFKRSNYKDDIKVAVLWEFWDGEKKEKFLLAENLKDKYLEKSQPWPEYVHNFGDVFQMYWDFAVPGQSRPMSAIAPWEPQILEMMILLGSSINHSKRWNRQIFMNNQAISTEVMDKFERGDDGAIHAIAGKVGPEDMRLVDFGALPVDFYLLMDRLKSIIRETNGQPEFTKGGMTKTGTRTIGELQLMEKGANSRQDRKIDRLETHLENIARALMKVLKTNFDFEETIQITGDAPQQTIAALGESYDPQTGQVKFTPADIEGEYDVDIKAGSTLPMDKQHRTQTLEIILQTIASVTAQGPMSPFLNTLIQELLRDYEIKSLQEAYDQEVQMAQQAKAEAQGQQNVENQKVEAEAKKREAQSDEILVNTAIRQQEAAIGPVGRAQTKKMEKHEPNVSESISFKDLPEDGRIQMAEQAGIHLSSAPLPVTNGAPK